MRIIHTSLSAKRSVVRQCAGFIFQRFVDTARAVRGAVSMKRSGVRLSVRPSVTGVNPAGDAGDTSPNILVGGTSTGISPNIITYFRI